MLMAIKVLIGLSLLPWLPAALLSVMVFDSPGSASNPVTLWLFGSVWAYGPLAGLGLYLSRATASRPGGAPWRLALPVLALLSGGLAAAALEVFCGGRFNGCV